MNRSDLERLVGEQMALNALNATQLALPWGEPFEVKPEPEPEEEKEEPLTLEEYLDENGDEVEDTATLVALLHGMEGVRQGSFSSGVRFVVAGKRKTAWATEPEHLFIEQEDKTWEHTTPEEFQQDLLSGPDDVSRYLGQDPDAQFNKDFWDSPAPLYHGTSHLKGVLKTGVRPSSESRGLGNRSVGDAVFTSLEPEGTESYTWSPSGGGGTVVIDTAAMKADGLTPRVAQEPQVVEHEALEAIAHRIGVEWEGDIEQGIDPNTVILYGYVPEKYLRAVE